ncbi:MAG: cold shock domain-containing protein [Prevotella sp.]|nr:cold shock domain-containing protein [Prevotella sp.]
MTGTIKMYDKSNGFGFIVGENGKEYYTKFDGLTAKEKSKAEKGVSVSFDLQEGLHGEEGVNVRLM